jgi:hypothetical protein
VIKVAVKNRNDNIFELHVSTSLGLLKAECFIDGECKKASPYTRYFALI